MIRRILTVLTAICLVIPVLGLPLYAQERQVGNRTPIGDRSEGRRIIDPVEAEKLRTSLVTAYAESDALIRYLAGYGFMRQSVVMTDYETVCQYLTKERVRVEQMSVVEIISHANNWPDAETLNRVVEVSRSVRADAKLQAVLQKADQYSQAGLTQWSLSLAKENNSRGVIAVPAYIAPTCDFNDPSNYPSGADIAISNGIGLALHTLADVLPDVLWFFLTTVPNFIKIALVIAAGVVDQVTNALVAVKADGGYCEVLRIFVEEQMAADGQIFGLQMQDFYLTFSLRSVRAGVAKAQADGVPLNCAMARLTEANAFFNGSDSFIGTGPQRVDALRKLRAAYQNIGASTCVQ